MAWVDGSCFLTLFPLGVTIAVLTDSRSRNRYTAAVVPEDEREAIRVAKGRNIQGAVLPGPQPVEVPLLDSPSFQTPREAGPLI